MTGGGGGGGSQKEDITVVPQLIGVLMAAAINFHMYFTVLTLVLITTVLSFS